MFKRINNWHLSALIAIVSIFSIALIQQYAFAQIGWTEPNALPGTTSDNNFIVNPVVDNLNLTDNGVQILGNNLVIDGSNATRAITIANGRELCLADTSGIPGALECNSTWPTVTGGVIGSGTTNHLTKFTTDGTPAIIADTNITHDDSTNVVTIGGSGGSANGSVVINRFSNGYDLLTLNASSGTYNGNVFRIINSGGSSSQSLIVEDNSTDATPFVIGPNGKVGIGTADPNPTLASNALLHIYAPVGQNAEIDIQSGGAGTNHWGIYQDKGLKDLVFFHDHDGNPLTEGNQIIFSNTGDITALGQICDSGGSNCIGDGSNYWSLDADSNLYRAQSRTYLMDVSQSLAGSDIELVSGSKLLWYPFKGAIRAGFTTGTQFNDTNIGLYSAAFGKDNIALGEASTVVGSENVSVSDYSFAGGRNMQLTSAADNTFVWGSDTSPVTITEDNAFLVFPTKPPGEVNGPRFGFGTTTPTTYFHINSLDERVDPWKEPFVISRAGADSYFFVGIENDQNAGAAYLVDGVEVGGYDKVASEFKNFVINRGGVGNVGIGITAPTSRLEVQGDIKSHGNNGVKSEKSDGYNYYIQLDKLTSYPPAADCDEESEQGRLFYHEFGSAPSLLNKLMLCGTKPDGTPSWMYVNVDNSAY